MNILILTSEFGKYAWGGLGRYINEIYSEIKEQHNTDVLNIPSYLELFAKADSPKSDVIVENDAGNTIVHVFGSDINRIFNTIDLFDGAEELITQIWRQVAIHFKKHYDIIFLQDYYNSLLAVKLFLTNHAHKIISVIHLPLYSGFTYFDKPLSDEIHHCLESIMIRYSEVIIVPSEFAKRVIVQSHSVHEDKIVINYHGSRYQGRHSMAEITNGSLNILSVQRFTEQKGLMYLFNILKQLVLTGIPFLWTFIGNGPKAQLFKDKIYAEGLDCHVVFLPFINQNTIHQYYRKADIFVSTTAYETYGFTINEAMSCGCLTLSFSNGSVKELVDNGENGILYHTGEYIHMIDAIKDYYYNPDKYSSLRENAIHKARSFSWVENINKLTDIFNYKKYEQ